MTKFLILALVSVAIISCGQRVAPKGPVDKVTDTKAF